MLGNGSHNPHLHVEPDPRERLVVEEVQELPELASRVLALCSDAGEDRADLVFVDVLSTQAVCDVLEQACQAVGAIDLFEPGEYAGNIARALIG
jgi:hypothetical protein